MTRPALAGWMMTSATAWHSTDLLWRTSSRAPAGAGRERCFEIESSDLHSAGEIADRVPAAVLQCGPMEAPFHGLTQSAAGQPVVAPESLQVLLAGKPGIERKFLRHPAQSGTRPG